jgi:hypothetical protein
LVAGLRDAAGFTGTILVRRFSLHARECTQEAWNVNVPIIF